MLRLTLLLVLCFQALMGYSSHAINAYAVAIYNEFMKEEPLQGIHTTIKDYNGIVYTKIYAFGTFLHDKPHVKIGNSKGSLERENPIIKNGLIIGYEMLFKHFTVQSGYLEVYIGEKLFDRSVYVK